MSTDNNAEKKPIKEIIKVLSETFDKIEKSDDLKEQFKFIQEAINKIGKNLMNMNENKDLENILKKYKKNNLNEIDNLDRIYILSNSFYRMCDFIHEHNLLFNMFVFVHFSNSDKLRGVKDKILIYLKNDYDYLQERKLLNILNMAEMCNFKIYFINY